MYLNRRVFMLQLSAVSGLGATGAIVHAQAVLSEADPMAKGMGYRLDATQVDKSKYAKYVAGQTCANCALYQGAAGSAMGGCSLFGNKQVAGAGWCNAWVKKG
jgi:hypothetical protein